MKLTTNDTGNDSSGATVSGIQVKFAVNSAGISHQKLLIRWVIMMIQREVIVMVPPKELITIDKNQPALTNITGLIQTPQALKTPTMHELITETTLYRTINVNRTYWRKSGQ